MGRVILQKTHEIDEIFLSIQGEGRYQGLPSVLVRFHGCNLSCNWCDSKKLYNSQQLSYDQILNKISKYNCKNVILTGGEPLLQSNIENFTKLLHSNGFFIMIETNGTVKKDIVCDIISISPKLDHSGNNSFNYINNLKYYINNYDYQIKFVVRDNYYDFTQIKKILNQIGEFDNKKVLVMPLSQNKKQLEEAQIGVVSKCIEFGYTYANRLQLQLWDEGNESIVYDGVKRGIDRHE